MKKIWIPTSFKIVSFEETDVVRTSDGGDKYEGEVDWNE